jgi:hypothetical protein
MKVKYQRQRYPNTFGPYRTIVSGLPFCHNPRGVLTHRVRAAIVILDRNDDSVRHTAFQYWCGNGVGSHSGAELLSEPPVGRLLCRNCEAAAQRAGEVTPDQLVGRHVHIGIMVPRRTCCSTESN